MLYDVSLFALSVAPAILLQHKRALSFHAVALVFPFVTTREGLGGRMPRAGRWLPQGAPVGVVKVLVHPAGHPPLSVESGGLVEDSRSKSEGGRTRIGPPRGFGFPPPYPRLLEGEAGGKFFNPNLRGRPMA